MRLFKTKSVDPKTLESFPEHSSTSPLSVHAMTIAYHQKPVLWDVDYDAPESALVAIVGPNGAGKTTFIKGCLNLIPRATGTVEFWGSSYQSQRTRVGYVPQRESVDWDFPVSVLDVVLMGRYGKIGWFRPITSAHKRAAMQCLEDVGLADFAKRQINQLSGGQQQRVFLARALAQESELYFMDEPFAGVDAATSQTIIDVLRRLKQQGKTVLCVHHDLVSVPEYFDHVLMLNTRVIAAGPTAETFTQEHLKKTYGARLTLLEEVSQAIAQASRGGV